MPALNFDLQWPDGEITTCYSPSSVVKEVFQDGGTMTIAELIRACELAFDKASRRVEERFGMPCRAARRQKKLLLAIAQRFGADEEVRIASMRQHEA